MKLVEKDDRGKMVMRMIHRPWRSKNEPPRPANEKRVILKEEILIITLLICIVSLSYMFFVSKHFSQPAVAALILDMFVTR